MTETTTATEATAPESATAPAEAAAPSDRPHYLWNRTDGIPPGEQLAALRRGYGAEPGTVPGMWPFYVHLSPTGQVSRKLRAEHLALTLYGVHQQSQSRQMHWPKTRLGEALRALRLSGRYSKEAVDRRTAQCATTDDVTEFAQHLRALITMLKTLPEPQGLDYDQLVTDLADWQRSERVGRVRRQLGADYFRRESAAKPTTAR